MTDRIRQGQRPTRANTSGTPGYFELRHPSSDQLQISFCYLCEQLLSEQSEPDHIIPRNLFDPGSVNRPHLPTHESCNRLKSKDDDLFRRMVQLMSSPVNATAFDSIARFMKKAKTQSASAYLVGRSRDLREYRLARTLIESTRSKLYFTNQGRQVPQIAVTADSARRSHSYSVRMCQGLFIRNVAGARPGLPTVYWSQYAKAGLTGEGGTTMEVAKQLLADSSGSHFIQRWGNTVFYAGSAVEGFPNQGFVFVEFYQSAGCLALFGDDTSQEGLS